MACGMLHLFGFQLPETHHHYLLATGFTDYWRRINIYWKDFMVRVVFNPVVFRLKRRPQPLALAVATAAVFLATWLLHAYQSFWLRGSWGFSVPDALFWGILGVLVLVNVQLDARRAAEAVSQTARRLRAAKTAGTFATIALLWSLWSSPSVAAWLGMLAAGHEGLKRFAMRGKRDAMSRLAPLDRTTRWRPLAILAWGLVARRDRRRAGRCGSARCSSATSRAAPTTSGWSAAITNTCSTPAAASSARLPALSSTPRPRRRAAGRAGSTSRRRRSRPGRWRSRSTTSASSCSSRT